MALVDSNYKFITVDIGGYGSNSDGGIWKSSKFGKAFDNGRIDIPPPKCLPLSLAVLGIGQVGHGLCDLRRAFVEKD